MSDIAPTNSLAGGGSAVIPPAPPTRSVEVAAARPPASSSSKGPVDVVDLSDHAKAVLARAKTEQVAADKLKNQLETSRESKDGIAKPSEGAQPSGRNGSQFFGSRLTDNTDSELIDTFGQGHVTSDSFHFLDYIQALHDTHLSPDRKSMPDFRVQLNDVFTPSTPEEIAVSDQLDRDWALANPEYMAWAKAYDPELYAHRQAFVDGTVTHLNLNDIPDLDLHNTVFIDHTHFGTSSGTVSFTYNQNAAIFKDPTIDYTVGSNGDVIGFKKLTPISA
jgi:hypothetical protein